MTMYKYQIYITTDDNKEIYQSHGEIQLNEDKFKEIEKLCHEWGYAFTDLIAFLINNLNTESAEQLISTMNA